MRARFKGDPERNNSGPEAVIAFGLEFSKGAWVGIDGLDPVSLRKIKGNSHFEVDEGKVAKAASVPAETPDEIPDNWRTAHHSTRVKWARQLGGTPANADEANTIIAAHFAAKAAPAAPAVVAAPSIADTPAKAGDDDWGDLDP